MIDKLAICIEVMSRCTISNIPKDILAKDKVGRGRIVVLVMPLSKIDFVLAASPITFHQNGWLNI